MCRFSEKLYKKNAKNDDFINRMEHRKKFVNNSPYAQGSGEAIGDFEIPREQKNAAILDKYGEYFLLSWSSKSPLIRYFSVYKVS